MQGNRNESAATGAAPAAEEGAALAVGSPGKILVVDDQRNMRTTLAMMLRGGGFEVDEAADGAEARDQRMDGRPRLVRQRGRRPADRLGAAPAS